MFKSLRSIEGSKINHSGRSLVGETMQLEGDLRTSGSIDVAGLINGNIFVSEMTVKETGSIRGAVEATSIEINGHVEGKITADVVIVGKTAVVKGDILFKLLSGTETIPIFGSMVQKGKFSAWAFFDVVSALNNVDFPTLG